MSNEPLDVWVEKNAAQLKQDIRSHLAYGDDVVRDIMISIRQWDENRHVVFDISDIDKIQDGIQSFMRERICEYDEVIVEVHSDRSIKYKHIDEVIK